MLTVEDWTDRGYKRFEISDNARDINKLADFMLQRRFDDGKGKKYFITVYCYDRNRYPAHIRERLHERYGFMPTVHMSLRDNQPFFNIEMNGITSIDEVESYMEKFWLMLDKPYYEEWDE